MKIPTILKGDDSGAITITLPDGRDFTGATLVLAYGGVTRSFTDLVPGATLSFGFTHDETAGFKLGCKPVLMRLIGPSGSVETVENAAMKIKVTDCLGEVNAGGSFAISPRDLSTSVPVTDLGDLSTTAKIGDLYDKVNEIVRVLAQRSLLVLTLCLGLAAGAGVQTARLEDLDRSSVVVTNVTGSSGVDTNAVRDIALWPATNYTDRATGEVIRSVGALADEVSRSVGALADKRDKTDLAVHATLTNVAPFGIDYWFVNDNRLSLAYTDDGFAAWSGFGFAITATQSDGTLKFHYGDPGEGSVDFNFLEGDLVIYYEPIDTYLTNHVKAVMKRIDTIALVSQLAPVATNAADALSAANEANAWSSATYAFMTGGRTNCWWSGTNYVFGSDAAARTRFAWEPGMDAATVPCSMALYEIREGVRERVWDQRDWTAWYWSFKAQQMETAIQGRIDALGNAVTNDAMYAWAKHYASDGVRNPDPSTTYIDTSTVTLSPGMRWETVATVSGASYWTIVGDGAVIGGSGTNATLQIRDFEGNEIMTVTKGEHRLAWLEHGEIVGNMTDAQGRVCFDMLADAQPTGYFSTTLDHDDFVAETSDDCPASYEWDDIGGGKWRVHFALKPGIQANSCFAKFMVEIEGQTIIRYNAGQDIQGGLIYNGVKIAPDISGSPAVGTVIQWKVVR